MKKLKVRVWWLLLPVLFLTIGLGKVSAQEVNVSSPQEFYDAWTKPNVTKIVLDNDIDYQGRGVSDLTYLRTTDIEITSNPSSNKLYGYSLKIYSNALRVRKPTTQTGKAIFRLHDITVENNGDNGTSYRAGFISDEGLDGKQASQWTFELSNVRVPGGWREYTPAYEFDKSGNKVTYSNAQRQKKFNDLPEAERIKYGIGETARLIRASHAQMNVQDKMSLYTQSENFYTGGLYLREGTDYDGAITLSNYSAIWFQAKSFPEDAGTGNLELAQNAKMRIRNTGTGSSYPAIYKSFENILIGENAEFIATVPGNAVQFVGKDKSFIAKKGSKVILNSMNGDSSIKTGGMTAGSESTGSTGNNTTIRFEPGSSLFIIGDAKKKGMIDMTEGENNTFIIDTPEQFDIRNTQYDSKGKNTGFKAVDMVESNTFQVLNSNIDMWHVDTPVNGMSDYAYPNVKDAKIFMTGKGSRARYGANSSDAKLVTEYTASEGNIRRITGLNTKPSVEWQYIPTDADKQFKNVARMVLGEVPDDKGLDNNGQLSFEKVYARAGQGTIKINDSTNKYPEKTKTTLNDGYIQLDNDDFYKAGTILSGQAFRTGLTGEVQQSPVVIDITPPIIAKLSESRLTNTDKKISGTGAEPNAKLYVTLNGKSYGQMVTVKADGSWEFNFSDYLKFNDVVKIYMEDKASKAPEFVEDVYDIPHPGKERRKIPLDPVAPPTNTDKGNKNPANELKYRDAIFKAATELKVQDNVPSNPFVEKKVASDTFSDEEKTKPITQVGTNLTYSVFVQNRDAKDSGKTILDSVIEDEIPLGLDFDIKNVKVIKNDKDVINNQGLSYQEYSKENQENKKKQGKLIFKSGDLGPMDSVTITFSVKVMRESADGIITNTATAKGYSPQLKEFDNPNSEKIELSNQASVNNPGGKVSGQLLLISAPTKFDFGSVKLKDYSKVQVVDLVSKDKPVTPLIVEDTRGARTNWRLTATLTQEMSYFKDNMSEPDELSDSLSFTYQNKNKILKLNQAIVIYDSKNHEVKDEYNISKDLWQQNKDDKKNLDGLKMKAKKVPRAQEYQGKLEWAIQDVETSP